MYYDILFYISNMIFVNKKPVVLLNQNLINIYIFNVGEFLFDLLKIFF